MPVVVKCRVCGDENVESGRLLTTVCKKCETEAARLLQETSRPRAGDMVKNVTNALGIPQCGGCRRRQAAMNSVDLRGPAMEVFKGLAEAIVAPEKVLEEHVQKVIGAEAGGAAKGRR